MYRRPVRRFSRGGGDTSKRLCEHHPEHTGCSYREAVPGHPCGHRKHTKACYTDELICGLEDEAAANDIIIDEDMMDEELSKATDSNLPEPHDHGTECYRLDCPHERGDHTGAADDPDGSGDCGYVEAVSGAACDYECSICSEENDVITITEFEELDQAVRHQEVPVNTPQDDLNLPDRLKARGFTGGDAETEILVRDVTWELIEKDGSLTVYDEEAARPSIYYYRVVLPEQYQRDEGVALPEIEVWYGMALRRGMGRNADQFAAANQALLSFLKQQGGPDCAEYDPDAGCVRLLKDVTMNTGLYIYPGSQLTSSTLDLNGKTLNGPDSYTIYLSQSIFSLIDSTGSGELQGGASGNYTAVTVYDASQLTIRGVTITGDGRPNKVLSVSDPRDPSGTKQGSILTVEDCQVNGAVSVTGRAKLVVEGELTTDYFQCTNKDISIRNGVTLDLSNLKNSEIAYATRDITILPDGDWDTNTPLVKTLSVISSMYFEMTDPPEGYYLANVVEGGFRTWTLKEKLPDELTVTFKMQPKHVSIPAEPRKVAYDKTYSIVFTPDPGYVVKSGNITVRQFADGAWSKRGHSYDQNTNTLTVEHVQHNLEISVLENIQLTYDDKPAGGSIVVYGENDAPLEADKVVAPNARIRIVAEPDSGYSLSKILVNGTEVKNNEVFPVTEPSEIKAEFAETVIPPDPPEIPQQDIPATTIFAGYQHTISAKNGALPLTWSVSSEEGNRLPTGLKLNPDSGSIYGTPVESGTFSFTVTVRDANGASGSRQFSILIREPQVIHVTGVELSRRTLDLTVGGTAVLTAKVLPEDAFYKTVIWQSDDPGTATVDGNGLVTAVKGGTANITVITEDGDKTDTCAVTVTNPEPQVTHVAEVRLNEHTLNLTVGCTAVLTAQVLPEDASNKAVLWQSDNPGTATVDGNGLVTAVKTGTANITVITEDGKKTDSCTVTVTNPRTGSGSGGGAVSINPNLLYGAWEQTAEGVWMFALESGGYAKNRWGLTEDSRWYRFDAEGRMLIGWQYIGDQWYYLSTAAYAVQVNAQRAGTPGTRQMKEGEMVTGWLCDPATGWWFWMDANGAMATGWREIDGKRYYFNPESDGMKGKLVEDATVASQE